MQGGHEIVFSENSSSGKKASEKNAHLRPHLHFDSLFFDSIASPQDEPFSIYYTERPYSLWKPQPKTLGMIRSRHSENRSSLIFL